MMMMMIIIIIIIIIIGVMVRFMRISADWMIPVPAADV